MFDKVGQMNKTSISISAINISGDRNCIYSFAKDFNGWFITNIESGNTEIMSPLLYEIDLPDLIFDIIPVERKILFTPRNARFFHIYDLTTKKEEVFLKSELTDRFDIDSIGFFSFCWNGNVYCIYRSRPIVAKYCIVNSSWSICNNEYEDEFFYAFSYSVFNDEVAIISLDREYLLIFSARTNEFKRVDFSGISVKINSVCLSEEYIWLYSDESRTLFQCNRKGSLICSFELKEFGLGQCPRMIQGANELRILYNIDNRIVTIDYYSCEIKTDPIDSNIASRYWFAWDNSKAFAIATNDIGKQDIERIYLIDCIDQSAKQVGVNFYQELSSEYLQERIRCGKNNMIKTSIINKPHMVNESRDIDLNDYLLFVNEE